MFRAGTKFVQQGFIRLRADIIEGNVHLYVEDSGPGIPKEKKTQIFTKFQESLDVLNQVSDPLCLLTSCQLVGVFMYAHLPFI